MRPSPADRVARAAEAERLHSRLIGNFEWSLLPAPFRWRAFRSRSRPLAVHRRRRSCRRRAASRSRPTCRCRRCRSRSASATRTARRSESQAFVYLYRDRARARWPWSTTAFSIDRPVDVTIAIARRLARARGRRRASGELDAVAWGAVQTRRLVWRAASRRQRRRSKPAIAGRARRCGRGCAPATCGRPATAIGDDDRHGTFFQMLPSSRKYALSSVYAQMNLRDAFAQAVIEPRRFNARIEVHAAARWRAARDLWYQGSGATASRGRFFGFSGRAAGGETSLGTVLEGTIDVPIRKYWSVNGIRRHHVGRRRGHANVHRQAAHCSGPSRT